MIPFVTSYLSIVYKLNKTNILKEYPINHTVKDTPKLKLRSVFWYKGHDQALNQSTDACDV